MANSLQKHISSYELFARYLPAIVTSVPYLLIGFILMRRSDTKDFLGFIFSLKFFGYVSMSFVALYLYAQLIRSTAKWFENRYFRKRQGFPTTYYMLYSNGEYSEAYKDAYRKKVKKVYNFDLCSKDEEIANPLEASRRLNDITRQIILRVADGKLVGKHNQWYGFIRNLVGGSIYAAFGSIIIAAYGHCAATNSVLAYGGVIMCLGYCAIVAFRRSLIVQHAEAYARQLHAEFMK